MNGTHQERIAVVGIGNLLLTDDGVGIHALRELEARYDFPEEVDLLDGGTMGLDLLPFLEGKSRILFLDAVQFREGVGSIGELNNEEIPRFFSTKLSVHQIALPDLLAAGKLLGTLEGEMCLLGIEPASLETGFGLSPELGERFEAFLAAIVRKLSDWGVSFQPRKVGASLRHRSPYPLGHLTTDH
jgi:hydrogenase maturation protease